MVQAILEDLGQNIFTAGSGEEALRHVLARDFALILLDVNMPGLDGLETAALIRNRKRSSHIPIIFITADYADELRTTKGYSLGAVDYITSPIVPEVLRAKVRVFVDLFLLAEQAKQQAQQRIALVEEKAARQAAERATRRLAFLAEATGTLAASLDVEAASRELAKLLVPLIADVCVLALHHDGRAETPALSWSEALAPDGVVTQPLEGKMPEWLAHIFEQCGDGTSKPVSLRPPAAESTLGGAGTTAPAIAEALCVPLAARGRTLGVLVLGLKAGERRFDSDALSIATDLASRAAISLDNALLYRKIHEEDRRKNEFLAMLAHELRNPLAPISNAVHLLNLQEQDPARLRWAREVIGRQLKQLVRLVDDLLDVSRITRGKIELKLDTIDAAAVVSAAVETSRPNVDQLDHTLTVMLPQKPLRMRGDFARVSQVLANLINNAAKYTPRGGRILLSAEREEEELVFRVRDSGVGIPAEFLDTIFQPFTQVDRTLDRSQGGLGIGLTLVRSLVDMQGGSVKAHSAGRDQGSEFVVRFPVLADRELALPSHGGGRDPRRRHRRGPARAGRRRQSRRRRYDGHHPAAVRMRHPRCLRRPLGARRDRSPASGCRAARHRPPRPRRLPGRRAHAREPEPPPHAGRRGVGLRAGGRPRALARRGLRLSRREADRPRRDQRSARVAAREPSAGGAARERRALPGAPDGRLSARAAGANARRPSPSASATSRRMRRQATPPASGYCWFTSISMPR